MNNQPRKTDRRALTRAQAFKLCKLLEAEFTSSGKSDGAFAIYASEVLGFPVTIGHVCHTRSDLEIPSNRTTNSPTKPGGLLARVAAIEAYLTTQLGAKL